MRRTFQHSVSTLVAVSGGLAPGIAVVNAQTITGSASYAARCGPSQNAIPFHIGDDVSIHAHGDCPAPHSGGLASSNDADTAWRIIPGSLRFEAHARTDFFGTSDDAGTASSFAEITFVVHDLLFTDIANPGQTGIVQVGGAHMLFGAVATTQGVSNCLGSQPQSHAAFDFIAGPCRASASRAVQPDTGIVESGSYVGYANDGAPVDVVASGGGVALATPTDFYLMVSARGTVVYCDFPPAAVGDAHALMSWSFPCGTPVFDLPPGITVNSPQLGIVNNIWGGLAITQQPASRAACFNGGAAFSVVFTGAATCRWQVEDPAASNLWTDLADGPIPGSTAAASGSATASLSVTNATTAARFRCRLSNTCHALTTDPAALSVCYANCDCSTGAPLLNVLDFACFVNKYASGDPYANCDGSTAAPSLNVLDFSCFLNLFAAGCS